MHAVIDMRIEKYENNKATTTTDENNPKLKYKLYQHFFFQQR